MTIEYTDEAITVILKKFVELPPVTNAKDTLVFLRNQVRFYKRFHTLRPKIDPEVCEFYSILAAYAFVSNLSSTSTMALHFADNKLESHIFFLLLEEKLLDSILVSAIPIHVTVNPNTGESKILPIPFE